MVTATDFQKAIELINKSTGILITTHTKPDGDACGCIAALCEVLIAAGKKPKPLLLSTVPEWYLFLFTEKPPVLGEDVTIETFSKGGRSEPDLIILVDTNSNSQLPGFAEYLKESRKPVLVFDHHVTADGLGDVELVDSSAAATALIIYDLLTFAGWHVSKTTAEALFVAISTDTGWFQFANTDSRVHKSCAALIDAGVNATEVYHRLYQNYSYARLKLMTAMLNTVQLHLDGRYADQYLTQADFQRTGAAGEDTENFIDQCRRIGSVEAAGLFVELPDGRIRCSLRSSGVVDVRNVAQSFGGGGHIMAAGAYLDGPLQKAKRLVFEQIAQQFVEIDDK